MSLETIYYISQILAVLGVIGSLIFVGLQMRQANVFARNEVSDRVGNRLGALQLSIMTDSELNGIVQRAYAGQSNFSEEEWTRLAPYMLAIISTARSMMSAKQSGLLEPLAEESGLRSVCWVLSKPAFAKAWKWQQKLEAHDPAIFEYVGTDFDKRYPTLAGSLRIDQRSDKALADPQRKVEAEPGA